MSEYQALVDRVRQHGLRLTRQRSTILRALYELHGHASAEKIHERIRSHHGDVDLSTVYRTLEKLRDLRILSQTDLGRGCAEFEVVARQPHHHLICQSCGRVIDLDHAYLVPAEQAIRRDFCFEPTLDHLAIFGLCHACRRAEAVAD
ncbi:MAG: transcriptional repressor [Anaerolineae bacterium]|nr:transcriptional repressor [Anaerolineae bacterium]